LSGYLRSVGPINKYIFVVFILNSGCGTRPAFWSRRFEQVALGVSGPGAGAAEQLLYLGMGHLRASRIEGQRIIYKYF